MIKVMSPCPAVPRSMVIFSASCSEDVACSRHIQHDQIAGLRHFFSSRSPSAAEALLLFPPARDRPAFVLRPLPGFPACKSGPRRRTNSRIPSVRYFSLILPTATIRIRVHALFIRHFAQLDLQRELSAVATDQHRHRRPNAPALRSANAVPPGCSSPSLPV